MSHDRYFLRRVATRVATIKDGVVTDYQGDYEVRRCGGLGGSWLREAALADIPFPDLNSGSDDNLSKTLLSFFP